MGGKGRQVGRADYREENVASNRFSQLLAVKYGYDDKRFQKLLSESPVFITMETNNAVNSPNLAGFRAVTMVREVILRVRNRFIVKPLQLIAQQFKSIVT